MKNNEKYAFKPYSTLKSADLDTIHEPEDNLYCNPYDCDALTYSRGMCRNFVQTNNSKKREKDSFDEL